MYYLLLLLCVVSQAFIIHDEPIYQPFEVSGHLMSANATPLTLPLDIAITPIALENSVVSVGDALFSISKNDNPLPKMVGDYFKAKQKQQMAKNAFLLESKLLDIEATSLNHYLDKLNTYQEAEAHYQATYNNLEAILPYFNLTFAIIDKIEKQSPNHWQQVLKDSFSSTISSPADGILVGASQGTLSSGTFSIKAGQVFANILNTQTYLLKVGISGEKITKITTDLPVHVRLPGVESPIPATIAAISYYPENIEEEKYTVAIQFQITPSQKEAVRLGMRAQAIIEIPYGTKQMVPFSYIEKKGSHHYVYVQKNGKVSRREVTVGMTSLDQIEILSGVHKGEEIVEYH